MPRWLYSCWWVHGHGIRLRGRWLKQLPLRLLEELMYLPIRFVGCWPAKRCGHRRMPVGKWMGNSDELRLRSEHFLFSGKLPIFHCLVPVVRREQWLQLHQRICKWVLHQRLTLDMATCTATLSLGTSGDAQRSHVRLAAFAC